MNRQFSALLPRLACFIMLFALLAPSAWAQANNPSGLPLPRFVSLKSGRVNSRIGPGVNYAVDWLYLKAGLPMEIIQEYDNWRRVRDPEAVGRLVEDAVAALDRELEPGSVPAVADQRESER